MFSPSSTCESSPIFQSSFPVNYYDLRHAKAKAPWSQQTSWRTENNLFQL